MGISTDGPQDKRSGTKHNGKADHDPKQDESFGNKTNYADFAKTKIGIGKDKKKG